MVRSTGITLQVALTAAFAISLVVAPTASASAATARPAPAPANFRTEHACATPRAGQAACLVLIRVNTSQQARTNSQASQAVTAPTNDGYGPASLQQAYNLPSAIAGNGETVAIVDAYHDPDAAKDMAAYRTAWGLPACGTGCFIQLNEEGQASNYPSGAKNNGWGVEETLDLDMVSAICPLCHIILVEATTSFLNDLGTSVNTAASVGAEFISNSYATGVSAGDPTWDADWYNHPGIAVVAAAGDSGYGVAYPAASPDVVAAGGTTLVPAQNTRGFTETAWAGTGSGCSADDAKPSWQPASDTPGCTTRAMNDVSAVADPSTGVAIYDTYGEPGWLEVGGTSVSSPIIASVFALAGTPEPGTYPASYLYQDPADFWAITSGSNGTCSPTYLCTAGTGYDGPTGLGSPEGTSAFHP